MNRRWTTQASTVGVLGPLLVRGPEDGLKGRVICAVPGHRRHRFSERDTVPLGCPDAMCWDEAQALLARVRSVAKAGGGP